MGILLTNKHDFKKLQENSQNYNWEPPVLNIVDPITFWLDNEDVIKNDDDVFSYLYFIELSNLENANNWLNLQPDEIQNKVKTILNEI